MKIYIYKITFIILLSDAFSVPSSFGDGIECNHKRFWAVSTSTGSIHEFELNGTMITAIGPILNIPGPSLAFCNNLSGGNFSPTFYTHITSFTPSIQSMILFYNGNDWDTSAILNIPPTGCGGYGDHVYFPTGATGVQHYDGTTLSQFPLGVGMIADLAVDVAGNAWLIVYSGPNTPYEIRVMNPSGQIIQTYSLSTTMQFATPYGCFFMNNHLYLGNNGTSSIYPITFSGNIADYGTPISTPGGSYSDLASCSPIDFATSVTEINNAVFFAYPNPSPGVFKFSPGKFIASIVIYNSMGQEILFSINSEIDLTGFPIGIFFYKIKTVSGEILKGTLIKKN